MVSGSSRDIIGDLSNIYSGVRLIADNFPEGYKLAVDSVAITTNRPFDFEVINEPGNFYSDGENPGTGEGFIDWHVSSTLAKPVTSYRVEKLDRVFEPYDPSAEYYYAVIARRYTTNSTYTWYHAFQPAAPVAIDPTDVDERGAYTANWEKSLKATRYSVTNYGAYFATKDEENHVLIDEDFSRITSEVTTVTDPTAPESLGNDYQLMSFDDYTILPGWSLPIASLMLHIYNANADFPFFALEKGRKNRRRISALRQRLLVGLRRGSYIFIKKTKKVGIILKAALLRYGIERNAAGNQFFRQHHPAIQHIFVYAAAGVLLKFVREVGHADAELLGQVFHVQRLHIIFVDVH